MTEFDYKIESVELVPGGRWMVTASHSDQPYAGFWLMVWDLQMATTEGRLASPVACYNVKTGSTPGSSALFSYMSIQPTTSVGEDGFLCFVFSSISSPDLPITK